MPPALLKLPHQSALAPWIDQLVGKIPKLEALYCVPFISHIHTVPSELRQRISLLPSPLKSPVSKIDQLVGKTPKLEAEYCVPFISHIPTVPSELRQRMSVLPSPLKSPVPTIVQLVGKIPKLV